MKQFDLFDKPMNGLYSRTSRGGILSCLGLLVAAIVSVYAVRVSQSAESHYAIQLADSSLFPTTLNIDIEVLDRSCNELTYHFNPIKSRAPEDVDIRQFNEGFNCRFRGSARVFDGEGDFHITPNDAVYQQQGMHRHASKSLTDSYNHIVHAFTFGNSTDLSNQSLQEVEEKSSHPHYTYFLKVYSIDRGFGYSVSRYTRETLISSPQQRAFPGIYFLYSMEPETLVKEADSKENSSLLIFISVFGSLYTLLSTLLASSPPQLSCSIAVPIRKVSINWIRLFVTNTSRSFPETCHAEVFVVCLVELRRRLHTIVKNPTSLPFKDILRSGQNYPLACARSPVAPRDPANDA